MSRLRLAAGAAIMKLAQEPCYHEIITPEQFQLCGLVINVSFTINLTFDLRALLLYNYLNRCQIKKLRVKASVMNETCFLVLVWWSVLHLKLMFALVRSVYNLLHLKSNSKHFP